MRSVRLARPAGGSAVLVRHRTAAIASAATAFTAAVAVALAATGAHAVEGEAEHGSPSIGMLVFNFVNFAIYAFILYRFAWPPIVKYLKERRSAVVAALEAARRARAEAEAMKAEYEARLRTLEADAERARAEVIAIAEIEAKNLLEEAHRSAERIANDARLVAEQEATRARHVLQEEAAALVARIAGDLIAKQLTTQDQARFVADFVAQASEAAEEQAGSAR